MPDPVKIYASKQPRRPHHIVDWCDVRRLKQSDLVDLLGVDKGTVSRWFSGSTPSERWQKPLADALGLEDEEALFRHPDDDWLSRFLRGRQREEVEQIKRVLEVAFPKKVA